MVDHPDIAQMHKSTVIPGNTSIYWNFHNDFDEDYPPDELYLIILVLRGPDGIGRSAATLHAAPLCTSIESADGRSKQHDCPGCEEYKVHSVSVILLVSHPSAQLSPVPHPTTLSESRSLATGPHLQHSHVSRLHSGWAAGLSRELLKQNPPALRQRTFRPILFVFLFSSLPCIHLPPCRRMMTWPMAATTSPNVDRVMALEV